MSYIMKIRKQNNKSIRELAKVLNISSVRYLYKEITNHISVEDVSKLLSYLDIPFVKGMNISKGVIA